LVAIRSVRPSRVLITGVFALALLAAAAPGSAGSLTTAARAVAAHPAPALSERALLARLTDPAGQLDPLPFGLSVSQVSSHDLSGGNLDGGSYSPLQAPLLPVTYVRHDPGGYTLADLPGPGCLVRIWMTASAGVQGDTSSYGRLQLLFDGSSRPAVDVPAATFFSGGDRRFPRPLVNDYLHSSGGNYSYIPFCFARRLQVRATGHLATMANFFQLTVVHAPSGTPVKTFTGGSAIARSAALALRRVGRAPTGPPRASVAGRLRAGRPVRLTALRGAGTVRYLQMRVAPFDVATLHALRLRVAVDGAKHPQVDVPLADVFGDGLETRPIRSLAFGMSPSTRTGYLALPIPYHRGARVTIATTGRPATVSIQAWTGPPSGTADRLYGRQLITRTRLGQDFPVLEAAGSGRIASYVMDLADSTPLSGSSPAQWFMEGDERVYVDGLRSPSIYGTGTEDEFNGGYYFNHGAFSLPLTGAGPLGSAGPTGGGTQSAYRVFADDGAAWSTGVDYRQQAGGNDERLPETAVATTFSYRGAARRAVADSVALGSAQSRRRHRLTGRYAATSLDAYFEGDRDGTLPVSTTVIGGSYYLSPPPALSSEEVSARGVSFRGPLTVTLRVPKHNRGVVLRRLADQATAVPVGVLVDGHPAGTWAGADFRGNPLKRWLETDFALPPRLTAGRSHLTVTLLPAKHGQSATAYRLAALAVFPPRM
jgi:hypothetical protein